MFPLAKIKQFEERRPSEKSQGGSKLRMEIINQRI